MSDTTPPSVQGEKLQLTLDGAAGGFASFGIPALADASLGWTATFDIEIIDSAGNNDPADGLSFNWGEAQITELGSAEEGMAAIASVSQNISFEIDTWMNGDPEQGVNIAEKVDGADANLAFTNGPILGDGESVAGTVSMSFVPGLGYSFSTTGLNTNADFVNVASSLVPSDAYTFVFSARVGGANQTVLIDNLVIETGPPEDSDGDGLTDVYETANGLDPADDGTVGESAPGLKDGPNGALGDPDGDTLTNTEERDLGTHPNMADTDGDDLDDNVENNDGVWNGVTATGTDPLNPDSDGDTLPRRRREPGSPLRSGEPDYAAR